MKVTKYEDINNLLDDLSVNIKKILNENLVGICLTGSLSYGGFILDRSDIDLTVVVHKPISEKELELLKKMHLDIESKYSKWEKRVECQYIPLNMFKNIIPNELRRPYLGAGKFHPDALYGNECLINNYALYKHGISLFGPEFKALIEPIDIKDVQIASARDLLKEWEIKIGDSKFFANGHYQSYLVLNLCRILYTVL